MTTGNIVFFSGVGLFAAAILLAIVFLIKKPKYEPEKAVYNGIGNRQGFRGAYPTERVTVRWENPSSPPAQRETDALYGPAEREQGTEIITESGHVDETELI